MKSNYNVIIGGSGIIGCSIALELGRKGVVDLYDVADDWIPSYDKSDLPGYYMAVGTSGNQYKTAPVVGKMVAELIVQCENGRNKDRAQPPARRGFSAYASESDSAFRHSSFVIR